MLKKATEKIKLINNKIKMKKKITKLALVILGLFVLTPAMAQTVNMNRWIELTVTQGNDINLGFIGENENTTIKITSGSYDTTLTIGKYYTGLNPYLSQGSTMTIYGDVETFECFDNGSKITGLNASNNIGLRDLSCYNNSITNLNISGLTLLYHLNCKNNSIANLNLSGLTSLKDFYCSHNLLTNLNVNGLTALEEMSCAYNSLTSLTLNGLPVLKRLSCNNNSLANLNVSGLSALYDINCSDNDLSSLDVRCLTALTFLYCYNNSISSLKTSGCINRMSISCYANELSACALDSVFHQLPNLQNRSFPGVITIKDGLETNPGTSTCRDTIASNRNWEVDDLSNPYPIVNSSYDCPYFTIGIEDIQIDNISAKVYPNPASSELNIECSDIINIVIFYDALGKEIFRTRETKNIDVSTLTEGVYFLKLITNKGKGNYKVIKQ